MPNPYHDAEGKFCSRGEMQAAIDTAQKNGDFDTYFRLRKDFEEIDTNKVTVSLDLEAFRQLLATNGKPKKIAQETDSKILALTYENLKHNKPEQDWDKERDYSNKMAALLLNENTPEDIKEEIFENRDRFLVEALISKPAFPLEKKIEMLQANDLYVETPSDFFHESGVPDTEQINWAMRNQRIGYVAEVIGRSNNPTSLYTPEVTELLKRELDNFNQLDAENDYDYSGAYNMTRYSVMHVLSTAPTKDLREKAFSSNHVSLSGKTFSLINNPNASAKEQQDALELSVVHTRERTNLFQVYENRSEGQGQGLSPLAEKLQSEYKELFTEVKQQPSLWHDYDYKRLEPEPALMKSYASKHGLVYEKDVTNKRAIEARLKEEVKEYQRLDKIARQTPPGAGYRPIYEQKQASAKRVDRWITLRYLTEPDLKSFERDYKKFKNSTSEDAILRSNLEAVADELARRKVLKDLKAQNS